MKKHKPEVVLKSKRSGVCTGFLKAGKIGWHAVRVKAFAADLQQAIKANLLHPIVAEIVNNNYIRF